jgi:hypothetical protein
MGKLLNGYTVELVETIQQCSHSTIYPFNNSTVHPLVLPAAVRP